MTTGTAIREVLVYPYQNTACRYEQLLMKIYIFIEMKSLPYIYRWKEIRRAICIITILCVVSRQRKAQKYIFYPKSSQTGIVSSRLSKGRTELTVTQMERRVFAGQARGWFGGTLGQRAWPIPKWGPKAMCLEGSGFQ